MASIVLFVFLSSKRAVDESEVEAAERRRLRCVWVSGGRALTEQEAAVEIVSEARLLLQEDLAQLGVQWDPGTLPPGPAVHNSDAHHSDAIFVKPSGSNCSPHETHRGKSERFKKTKSGEDSQREENKEGSEGGEGMDQRETVERKEEKGTRRERGKSKPEEKEVKRNLEEQIKEVTANDTESPSEKREEHKRLEEGEECKKKAAQEGGETSEGSDSARSESHQPDQPPPERSLTQELAEILSSPLPGPPPLPQPSPSPRPPPRLRAPVPREEQRHVSLKGPTGNGATPVQPGRLKHSRALSKVLHSIQSEETPQEEAEAVQRTSAPPAWRPPTFPAPEQQTPPGNPVPKNADSLDFPLFSSATSAPLFSPEAKRSRMEAGEADTFSSPELYAGDENGEDVQADVQKDLEIFGDSFELDSQTERIIERREGNEKGRTKTVEGEDGEEDAVEMDEETREGRRGLEARLPPACPRFSISLTDSQMELILNTGHQVSDLTCRV